MKRFGIVMGTYKLEKIIGRIGGMLIIPIKWPFLIVFLLLTITACYLLYPKIENFFIFFPQKPFDFEPQAHNLSYMDVYFNTKDGVQLHGWFFPLKKGSQTILFCHGNAGNISHRIDNITLLLERKFQVFIFDYRGYGKSKGNPSEEGIYTDARAAYDWLITEGKIDPDKVVLFGRSLGGAAAIDLALNRNVKSMIIESAFLSTKEIAKSMLLFKLLYPILPANYDNLSKITAISIPKLIIHGEDDTIVPFYMGKRLYESAKEPKFFFTIKGAGHNDTYIVGGEKYFQVLASFIKNSKI